MGTLYHETDWSKVKEKLMEKYPSLTEKDFEYEDNEGAFLSHLSQKTGESKEKLREIIRNV